MKVIKKGNLTIIVLDTGTIVQRKNLNDSDLQQLQNQTDQEAEKTLLTNYYENEEYKKNAQVLNDVKNSNILKAKGSAIYWEGVSELSMPVDFIIKVLQAEKENNTDALEAYKNFWVLLSLNPDSRCRANLFWYLNTWGMKISKTGLFIGYRNVVTKKTGEDFYSQEFCDFVIDTYKHIKQMKQGPSRYYVYVNECGEYDVIRDDTKAFKEMDTTNLKTVKVLYDQLEAVRFKPQLLGGENVYTDGHSKTFTIKIGELVTMPREECDSVQENQCSRGLHLANAEWLTEGYFGDQGLVCLCNPKDVVAVPYDSSYGKLRTCAYLPIALTEYDSNGNVIPYNVNDGFESDWVKKVLYDGELSNEDSPEYKITIPHIPELSQTLVTNNLLEIARKFINKN